MGDIWEDVESTEVIDKWRKEKILLTVSHPKSTHSKAIVISRNLLCFILNSLEEEGQLKSSEIHKQISMHKGIKRPDSDVIDPENNNGRGVTLGEIKKSRKEASDLEEILENFFEICPRCCCPKEHCSGHC